MKNKFLTHSENLQYSLRYRINPIRNLTPQTLTRVLDNFHQGHLAPAALTWDAIERRDDILQGIISKRKKAVARLKWEIITLDHSHEAQQHKEALLYFYNNLTATHACDANQTGGLSLLIKQMLDAIAKKYSAHEVIYQSNSQNQITASFRFVPLWFFENTTGKLRLLKSINSTDSIPLNPKNWLITIGDGLMESSSIAQPEPFNGTYHLRFSLFERDINQLYTLTCDMLPNHHLLDQKPFSLFNRPLALNLLTISSHWQGTIHYITLTTKYHTFST